MVAAGVIVDHSSPTYLVPPPYHLHSFFLSFFVCVSPAALLEEPYKNKVCGHVYSKEAILQYIRTQKSKRRPCKCPTAGCANGNVTEDQLEKDAMMEINVNRERRRIDKHRLDMASQASQVDDDDDEEEEVAVF